MEKEKREKVIHLRLTQREFIEVKMLAEKMGYSNVSRFIRSCMFDRVEVERWKADRKAELDQQYEKLGLKKEGLK